MNTKTTLVERNFTRARLERAASRPCCNKHPGQPLDGGPVQYRCPEGDGHRVMAADIDREYHAPTGGAA